MTTAALVEARIWMLSLKLAADPNSDDITDELGVLVDLAIREGWQWWPCA